MISDDNYDPGSSLELHRLYHDSLRDFYQAKGFGVVEVVIKILTSSGADAASGNVIEDSNI